jgi:hypothetical protein
LGRGVEGGGYGDGGGSKIKLGKCDRWWRSWVASPQNTWIAVHA